MTGPRWSGYATQSRAWQQGYDWATDRDPVTAPLDIDSAMDLCGIDFDTPECEQFTNGADFAHNEMWNGDDDE